MSNNNTLRDDDNEPHEPLRKKLKHKSTGREDNFVASYYNPPQRDVVSFTQEELIEFRRRHKIKVSAKLITVYIVEGTYVHEKVDGEDPALPIKEFAEAGLSEEILLKLQEKRIQVRH